MRQRPTISVCMATYCGERFVVEQLRSILVQLEPVDEVIVIDDASKDGTVDAVRSIDDPRVRIVQQTQNLGVIRTFEAALGLASGEVIFLADQDDVWAPNKVERFLRVFETQPDATLVLSDFAAIDAAGKPMEKPMGLSAHFRRGLGRNLIRNHYRGSAMAFRASLRDRCLPFPAHLPMHDSWIGLTNEIFGKTVYLNEPLLLYRRHNTNATGERRNKASKVFSDRVWLMAGLAGHFFRRGKQRQS